MLASAFGGSWERKRFSPGDPAPAGEMWMARIVSVLRLAMVTVEANAAAGSRPARTTRARSTLDHRTQLGRDLLGRGFVGEVGVEAAFWVH